MSPRLLSIAPLLMLAACQHSQPVIDTAQAVGANPAKQGEAFEPDNVAAFAQAVCADCHSIERQGLSPNPQAPTFPEIANRPGITRDTLSAYLTDAHNYPDSMDFELTPERSKALADYLLGLRETG